ncbi:VOC family protein [Arthrobacter sp. NPDC058130]|uniref:VOC family protein n=1 Tax=Arthrobacter sp. NPDC058130 TaxID=3346353 RepID=UPI0036EC50B9
MDRSVSFYTEVLGLWLDLRAGNHWASIDAGDGLILGLHPAGPRSPVPGTSGAVTVGLGVDEPIEQVILTLEERGVVFREPVTEGGGLKLAFFTDRTATNSIWLSPDVAKVARWLHSFVGWAAGFVGSSHGEGARGSWQGVTLRAAAFPGEKIGQ